MKYTHKSRVKSAKFNGSDSINFLRNNYDMEDSNGKLHYKGYEFENGKYTYKFLLSLDGDSVNGTFDFDFTIYDVSMGKAQVIGEKGRENVFIVDLLVFTDTHIDFTKNCVGKVFIDLKAKKIDMEIQRSKQPFFQYEPIEK